MKFILIFIVMFTANCSIACSEERKEVPPTFARLLEDSTGSDILVFYPYEVEGAQITSVSVLIFKDGKLGLSVSASILKVSAKEHKLDPMVYRFTYLAFEDFDISSIKILLSYSYPPSDDGLINMCSPFRQYDLDKIIQKA